MNYPPKYHQDNTKEHMIEVIKTYPLATVISIENNQPLITHLPLIYRETDGKLIGHIDIYNPQTKLMCNNNPLDIIFSGPQCYISPSVYTTTQLPTWNYIKVHLNCTVKAIESKEALKASLISMTEFLEAPNHKYKLEVDNPRMEANLDYIKMFEITIHAWEGKFKLSQDKKTKDTANARAELIRANQDRIKTFLDKVF
ncbi:FMN-binding negative transcriptional regulator [Lacinutrix iliipiscaria]|uniref:FMN-binding negative transcriptional regulator n=1 Tax=Lacinutrix iliipiscaria TaxID=1230532 RepID=A0ABW5WK51_9FLAO